MNAKTLIMLLLLVYTINEKNYGQQNFEFEYSDFEVTVFPNEPGICPGKSSMVKCLEDFNSYKWDKLEQGPTIFPLFGKEQEFFEPGQYTLTVEKMVNNTLCSKVIHFEVHDLSNPEGIEKYLLGNGFHKIPIFVDQPGVKSDQNDNRVGSTFQPLRFNEDFDFLNLDEGILKNIIDNFKPFADDDVEVNIVESTNETFCVEGVDNLENEFNSNEHSFWVHQFTSSEMASEGFLYIKALLPFEGFVPKTQAHSDHLTSIFNDVITNAQNNIDAAKATFEHLRVFVSNLMMPHPTGGYTLENECQITLDDVGNNHIMTPGQTAVRLANGISNIFFDSDYNSMTYGSMLKFDYADKVWQNYHRAEDFIISNGYFNPINAEFYENFTTTITECFDCVIDMVSIDQGCDNYNCTLETDKYTNEYFNLDAIADGGFNYEISSCLKAWKPTPISKRASRQLVYNLLCAIKSGDTSFEFDNKFKDKVIVAKDIRLGDQKFEFVGVTMPKYSNVINLLPKPSHDNYGDVPGFIHSYNLSSDDDVRLNFFQFNLDDADPDACKSILKSSYSYPKWDTKFASISSCLPYYSIFEKNELLDYINPKDQKNLLLMVNGYRMFLGNPGKKWYKGGVEYPAPDPDEAFNPCFDDYEGGSYWGDMGTDFIDRINENVLYVDGHHSISTSNHVKMLPAPPHTTPDFLTSVLTCLPTKFLCSNFICSLNDDPNPTGFLIRYSNGFDAGQEIWQSMVDGDIKILLNDDKTAILGKIDVVAHSMGYAYAKGVLDYLSTKIPADNTFGNFYIIAPENAEVYTDEEFESSSIGVQTQVTVDLNDYEDVYQYGSNFNENGDSKCKQDGVAPQSRVRGLPTNNLYNVFIPDSQNKIKSFIRAHSIKNQSWILGIPSNKKGYIKNRE